MKKSHNTQTARRIAAAAALMLAWLPLAATQVPVAMAAGEDPAVVGPVVQIPGPAGPGPVGPAPLWLGPGPGLGPLGPGPLGPVGPLGPLGPLAVLAATDASCGCVPGPFESGPIVPRPLPPGPGPIVPVPGPIPPL